MLRKKVKSKTFPVKVSTLEHDIRLDVESKATGQDLFNLVCSIFGIRETWFFGIQYVDSNGRMKCLKLDKKVKYQGVPEQNTMIFMFMPKFYPEDVEEELTQEVSRHFFYLHVQCAITGMDIYCSPEDSVLLASYAVQAKLGDYDGTNYKPSTFFGTQLLPQSAIDYYEITADIWDERVKVAYSKHIDMTKEEAELEYLKIAEKLEMYGVDYFPITNKNDTNLWLGITPLGINIYEKENKLSPESTFQWSEIRNITFKAEKLIIKLVDKLSPNVVFFSRNVETNKLIIDLYNGNRDLFMTRRKPDSPLMMHLKMQAREEKSRRQTAHNKFLREKFLRQISERERRIIAEERSHYRHLYDLSYEALSSSISTTHHFVENYMTAQKVVMLLNVKFSDAKHKLIQFQQDLLMAEEEKARLEQRIWEAEQLSARLTKELERQAPETYKLKKEVDEARMAEKLAKEKFQYLLLSVSSLLSASYSYVPDIPADIKTSKLNSNSPSYDFVDDNAVGQLSVEYDKKRDKILEKNKQLQNQLAELKTNVEMLKIDHIHCKLEILHAEQVQKGENKYSTLKKVKSGPTITRVTYYEEL